VDVLGVSASSSLVDFDVLSDNRVKGLTRLLSVEQEFNYIAYTCKRELYDLNVTKVQQEVKPNSIPQCAEMKAKLYVFMLEDLIKRIYFKHNNANRVDEMTYVS
jgi:hypothetical protein